MSENFIVEKGCLYVFLKDKNVVYIEANYFTFKGDKILFHNGRNKNVAMMKYDDVEKIV